VAFLMFALGAEFSRTELKRLGRVASIGGPVQILATMGVGPLLAPILGLDFQQGLFLGALLALSSTVVAIKVLMGRGELQALHGRMAVGVLVAQDLAVVPMVVILPALSGGSDALVVSLGIAGLKALAVLAGAFVMATKLVPWLLSHTAASRNRELFLLSVVALALGTAVVTALAGLSLAFGAFLAGLVVAESEFRAQVVAEVLPLRDLFASLFFVSVGMLLDPQALLWQLGDVALLTVVTVVSKTAIVAGVVVALGMPLRSALLTGLSLAQVGEFSFVLARIGVSSQSIPETVFQLILATAIATIVLSPLLIRAEPLLVRLLHLIPPLRPYLESPVNADAELETLSGHTVICGYGRVARELLEVLESRGLKYLVIDHNPDMVRALREKGVPVIYGDASNPAVLEHAHLERARLLALLMPDASAAEIATRFARGHNRRLDVVARAATPEDLERLRKAGATAVVQPEFEAGVEVIRHALRRYGVGGMELTTLVNGRRALFYRREGREGSDQPAEG
jgi:CPA2 family monovalent cation:H+ antiporter-2